MLLVSGRTDLHRMPGVWYIIMLKNYFVMQIEIDPYWLCATLYSLVGLKKAYTHTQLQIGADHRLDTNS